MLFVCALHDDGDGLEPREIDSPVSHWAAEEFAEYLFYECDGWEWMKSGNVVVNVVPKSGGDVEQFSIDIEYDPSFYAREV